MTLLKIYLYILRNISIHFTICYNRVGDSVHLPPPPVRTGRSRLGWTVRVECSPQVSQGDAFFSGTVWGESVGYPVESLLGVTRWMTRFR